MRAPPAAVALVALLMLGLSGGAFARPLYMRSMLAASGSMEWVYNGSLSSDWSNWSWNVDYYSPSDSSAPLNGSSASLCATIQPYGALSLRSSSNFSATGTLVMWIRGGDRSSKASNEANASLTYSPSPDTFASSSLGQVAPVAGQSGAPAPAGEDSLAIGDLELQFESTAGNTYVISRSVTVSELLNNSTAALEAVADGTWTRASLAMASLDRAASDDGDDAAISAASTSDASPSYVATNYDRITIGSCLQNFDRCVAHTMPDVTICVDQLGIQS